MLPYNKAGKSGAFLSWPREGKYLFATDDSLPRQQSARDMVCLPTALNKRLTYRWSGVIVKKKMMLASYMELSSDCQTFHHELILFHFSLRYNNLSRLFLYLEDNLRHLTHFDF